MSRNMERRWGLNTRFIIGKQDNPMMTRWRLLQTPWFGLYVHFIYREDLDPYPHDHPWNFWRMVLKGGYIEEYSSDPTIDRPLLRTQRCLRLGRFPVKHAHRITFVMPGTVSLVLVGRRCRDWGFWRHGLWSDYRDVLGLR